MTDDTEAQHRRAVQMWEDRSAGWDKWKDQLRQSADAFNVPLVDAVDVAPARRWHRNG